MIHSRPSIPGSCTTPASCPVKLISFEVCPRAEPSFKCAVVDNRWRCGWWWCRWHCYGRHHRAPSRSKGNIIYCDVSTNTLPTYSFKHNLQRTEGWCSVDLKLSLLKWPKQKTHQKFQISFCKILR